MNLSKNLPDINMLAEKKTTRNKIYDDEREFEKNKYKFKEKLNEDEDKISYEKLKNHSKKKTESVENDLKNNNIAVKTVENDRVNIKKTVTNELHHTIKEKENLLNSKENYKKLKDKLEIRDRFTEDLSKGNLKAERNKDSLFNIRTNENVGKERKIELLELKKGYKNLKVEVREGTNAKSGILSKNKINNKEYHEVKEQSNALSMGNIIKKILEKTPTSTRVNLNFDARIKLGDIDFKIQDLSKYKVGKTNQINILLNIDGEKVRLVAASNDSEVNIRVSKVSEVIKERIETSIREIRLENRSLEINLEIDEKGEEREKKEKRDDQSKQNREKEYKEMKDKYEFRKRVEKFGFN